MPSHGKPEAHKERKWKRTILARCLNDRRSSSAFVDLYKTKTTPLSRPAPRSFSCQSCFYHVIIRLSSSWVNHTLCESDRRQCQTTVRVCLLGVWP